MLFALTFHISLPLLLCRRGILVIVPVDPYDNSSLLTSLAGSGIKPGERARAGPHTIFL
jgi:hypothetical protein